MPKAVTTRMPPAYEDHLASYTMLARIRQRLLRFKLKMPGIVDVFEWDNDGNHVE
jgi:hypothetical protein